MAGSADCTRSRIVSGRFAGVLLFAALLPGGASAAVIDAGTGTAAPTLAAALRLARNGDTIRLAAGTYYECGSVSQADLVLEGAGPGTRLTDATCEGKAVLVAHGDRLTVRNLVLSRARVPDHNGAGIRLEAQGLVLDGVGFENNEMGVLAGAVGAGQILVRNCSFTDGGVGGERPSAALNVGEVALLRVEASRFERVKGRQIVSGARRTEIVGSAISTGIEAGPGPAVQAMGGLLIENSTLGIGPHAPPYGAAVLASGPEITIRGTTLANTTNAPGVLLLNWGDVSPRLENNVVAPGDAGESSSGKWRHRAGSASRELFSGVRGAAGSAKRAVLGVIGR